MNNFLFIIFAYGLHLLFSIAFGGFGFPIVDIPYKLKKPAWPTLFIWIVDNDVNIAQKYEIFIYTQLRYYN